MKEEEYVNPYPNLNIEDYSDLYKLKERFKCTSCKRSRKFFCYSCSLPHPDAKINIPKIRLPIKVDIIKHKQEVDGKSTACHAKIIAPEDVKIYIYPDIPDYEKEIDDIILIFVSPNAIDVKNLFKGYKKFNLKNNYGLEKGHFIGTFLKSHLSEIIAEEENENTENVQIEEKFTLENLPIKKAVFIDSTWNQCRSIYKDPRINAMRTVIIQNRTTKFWRHQKGVPKWYLSTIEAIHQLLMEFHINAFGIDKTYFTNCLQDFKLNNTEWISQDKIIAENSNQSDDCDKNIMEYPYSGQYDNLLYFYSFIYSLIQSLDDPNQCLPKHD